MTELIVKKNRDFVAKIELDNLAHKLLYNIVYRKIITKEEKV